MHYPVFEYLDKLSFAFLVCIILYIDGKQCMCSIFIFVLYILVGLQYERPWLKGQPSPLELIHRHCRNRLNISSAYNDFGYDSFKKINFSKNSHLNALESKFDLDIK